MSEYNDFGGGGVLPPSSEDYKRMWEERSKQMKENEYNRQSEYNKRQARKEVFQEAVKKAVEVKNPDLEKAFFENINLTDK
jgi:hypothetical protein